LQETPARSVSVSLEQCLEHGTRGARLDGTLTQFVAQQNNPLDLLVPGGCQHRRK